MLTRDLWSEIRVMAKLGKPIKAIAGELGISKNTVRRALRQEKYAPHQREKINSSWPLYEKLMVEIMNNMSRKKGQYTEPNGHCFQDILFKYLSSSNSLHSSEVLTEGFYLQPGGASFTKSMPATDQTPYNHGRK